MQILSRSGEAFRDVRVGQRCLTAISLVFLKNCCNYLILEELTLSKTLTN